MIQAAIYVTFTLLTQPLMVGSRTHVLVSAEAMDRNNLAATAAITGKASGRERGRNKMRNYGSTARQYEEFGDVEGSYSSFPFLQSRTRV